MMFTKTQALSFDTLWPRLAAFALVLTLALLVPLFGWPQPVTGPLVNALLLIAVETLGLWPAIGIGLLTPLGGALHGVLPLPLLVMIPFIMLGNAALVSAYSGLLKHLGPGEGNRWLALGIAAAVKFALLHGAVTFFVARPVELALGGTTRLVVMPAVVVNMMSWPQLATAIAGGMLAFAVLRAAKIPISRRGDPHSAEKSGV